MLDMGVEAILTCVDSQKLAQKFAGHLYNEELLSQLPEGVDPCGERGEFHTFCFRGPMFSSPIPIDVGETLLRK